MISKRVESSQAKKEGDDADDAKPVGDDLAGALPSPVGGQRVGLVDGNQLDRNLASCLAVTAPFAD